MEGTVPRFLVFSPGREGKGGFSLGDLIVLVGVYICVCVLEGTWFVHAEVVVYILFFSSISDEVVRWERKGAQW